MLFSIGLLRLWSKSLVLSRPRNFVLLSLFISPSIAEGRIGIPSLRLPKSVHHAFAKADLTIDEHFVFYDPQSLDIEFVIRALVIASSVLLVLSIVLIVAIRKKQRINKLLAFKIKERTHQLELSRGELLRVSTYQTNFFTKAFQDIKAPLATMNGVYRAAFGEVKDEVALHYLNKTQMEADHLSDLVNRLTLVNKLNQHKLPHFQIPSSGASVINANRN